MSDLAQPFIAPPEPEPAPVCKKCGGTGVVSEWRKPLVFNPGSSPQVKDLIRHFKLKVPIKRGTDKPSTEQKYLRRFGKKYPVFKSCLDVRRRSKLISSYMWPLDAEGYVHTILGFHPSTWRKSSRKQNLQVIPKRTELDDLAELFRYTIRASPGNVLIEADSSAIEAVLTGIAAGDPDLVRISKAGVHDFFMSHVRGNPIDRSLPFDQLKAACQAAKKYDKSLPVTEQLRDRCKRTIHGSHYGLTPYGMNDEYEEVFPTQRIASEFQQQYLCLFPSIEEWMKRTRAQASQQCYLDNHFQYRHYFYDVFGWDSKYKRWVLGSDGKRCIAFGPQSDASAMQSEYLLAIAEKFQMLLPWLRLLIHDSFIFEVPMSEMSAPGVPWVAQAIADCMNMPFPELGGERCGVEVAVGDNLRDMSVVEVHQLV